MTRRQQILDKVGACASAICAVHCILTGVALGLLSSLGLGFVGNIWVDVGFLGIAIVVGAWAMIHGVRKHGSFVPALFYVTGLVAIVSAHYSEFTHGFPIHEHQHSPAATWLSVLGGSCFVLFHILNLRLQHLHHQNCGCVGGDRS